jgi:hypothetical protein
MPGKTASMTEPPMNQICVQCNSRIDLSVYNHSLKKYKFPLCEDCQIWFIGKVFDTTRETIQLYFTLKNKGIPVQLEKHFKYKRVDIVIEEARMHIEVDISHQQCNTERLLLDLKSMPGDFREQFMTLRIPEILVKYNMAETSDLIERHILENKSRREMVNRSN